MAEDIRWQERIKHEIDARRLAGRILGVDETASREEIKRAWRRECRRTHPDQNPDVPDAPMKFRVVNCAYRFLTDGTPCEELFNASKDTETAQVDRRYNLDNTWGMFLWWRDRFF